LLQHQILQGENSKSFYHQELLGFQNIHQNFEILVLIIKCIDKDMESIIKLKFCLGKKKQQKKE